MSNLVKNILTIFFFIGCTFCYNKGNAQLLFGLTTKKNALSISNGFSSTGAVYNLSYARKIHLKIVGIINEDMTLFTDVSDRFNFNEKNNFQFVYGGQGYLFRAKKFKVLFRKTLLITKLNTEAANATYVGAELDLIPGIYTDTYFYGLDLYYGDSYKGFVKDKQNLLSNVEDIGKGWVKPHRGTFKLGLNGGYYVKPNLCVYGYINFLAIKPRKDLYLLPEISGTMGINYLF
jgi:hypothetical protein